MKLKVKAKPKLRQYVDGGEVGEETLTKSDTLRGSQNMGNPSSMVKETPEGLQVEFLKPTAGVDKAVGQPNKYWIGSHKYNSYEELVAAHPTFKNPNVYYRTFNKRAPVDSTGKHTNLKLK